MKKTIYIIILVMMALWLWNSSLWTKPDQSNSTKLLSHRGVHQTFDPTIPDNDDCTALLIDEPRHQLIENTIPSMEAAFNNHADIVEIDIHPLADGHFIIFHDWTLECRTNGAGTTSKTSLIELQKLDIAYGYSHNGGKTFPLRGKGVGLMPTLRQVLANFPEKKFLVNFKGNKTQDGVAFANFIKANPQWRQSIWGVYGGGNRPVQAALKETDSLPDYSLRGYSRSSTKTCLKNYALTGWSGMVPEACHNMLLPVPINYAKFLWGWPHKFTNRLNKAGTDVILLGPHKKSNSGSTGIDNKKTLAKVPHDFSGYVWTNRIEKIGPLLKADDHGPLSPRYRRCDDPE